MQQTNRISAHVERPAFSIADYLQELRFNSSKQATPQSEAIDALIWDVRPKLQTEIAKGKWLPSMNAPPTSADKLIRYYMRDVSVLKNQWDELNRFLWALVAIHTTVHRPLEAIPGDWNGTMVAEVLRQTKIKFGDMAVDAWQADASSVLSANLTARPLNEMFDVCKRDIVEKVINLANYVVQHHFADGIQRGIYGLHIWTSPSDCWYVRNTHDLRPKSNTTQVIEGNRALVKSRNDIWMTCNEVHLTNAKIYAGMPWGLDWPESIWGVMKKVPEFLKPFVSTIVGTMTKKRTIAWYVETSEITSEVPVPMPAPVKDPAVVIGGCVLTGWEKTSRSWW